MLFKQTTSIPGLQNGKQKFVQMKSNHIKLLIPVFLFLLSSPLNANSQINDFRGKITYQFKFPNGYISNIQGFDFIQDSLITYSIKGDSLVAKTINISNEVSNYYVKIGNNEYVYNPINSILTNYKNLPNVFNYRLVCKFELKENILGYLCTKLEYELGGNTKIFFWVADEINLKNCGSFFNFISNQGKLVLKRQLIYKNFNNIYEAIKIENGITKQDFNLPETPVLAPPDIR